MKAEPMQMIVRFAPHLKLRLGEWLSSVILFSMGLVLFVFPNILNGRIFPLMRDFGSLGGEVNPSATWIVILFVFGGGHLIALYINGRKPVTPYIRLIASFLSCFVWWQITVSLFLSGVPALVWGVFPWLLVLEIYNVFQASADAREVFDTKRTSQNGLGTA
jgi:hypothetical protein